MSQVIITIGDMYQSFLLGIRQYGMTQVQPSRFNRHINACILKWVKDRLPVVEFNQKMIDDLEALRIVTDGEESAGSLIPIKSYSDYLWSLPKVYLATTDNILMADKYPLYLHGLNAMFKTEEDDQWKRARILRSDNRAVVYDDPFESPSDDFLYFENIGGDIRLIGSTRKETLLRLEYFRYPKIVEYREDGDGTDPEFNFSQNQEIVDMAVRKHLELSSDPRLQTFTKEGMIKNIQ